MPEVLLAVAKALAGVPGLAPVFNPIIALREDEKAATVNSALIVKISEEHEVTREMLRVILNEHTEIRNANMALKEQLISGFYAFFRLISIQNSQILDLMQMQSSTLPLHQVLEERISRFMQENEHHLAEYGLVTREVLRDELVRLFSDDVKTFLAVVQPAGFPKGWVPTNVAPIQAYYAFLERCEGLERQQVAHIARSLSDRMPGSPVMRTWADMYDSRFLESAR